MITRKIEKTYFIKECSFSGQNGGKSWNNIWFIDKKYEQNAQL